MATLKHYNTKGKVAKKQKSVGDYFSMGLIGELVLKNILLVAFWGFLLIIYIANAHYSEKQVLEIQQLQKEVKELRWRYMSIKSEMMYDTKQSEVAKSVDEQGLKIRSRKPKKLIIDK